MKRGNLETDARTQEEHHVKMKAGMGLMCLQAEEHQGLPAAPRGWGRCMGQIAPQSL